MEIRVVSTVMIIIKGMIVKDKKKKLRREGLVSTKLNKQEMSQVYDWVDSSGLHIGYVIRALITLGLFHLENDAPNDPYLVLSKAGTLENKKAA